MVLKQLDEPSLRSLPSMKDEFCASFCSDYCLASLGDQAWDRGGTPELPMGITTARPEAVVCLGSGQGAACHSRECAELLILFRRPSTISRLLKAPQLPVALQTVDQGFHHMGL